MTQSPSVKPASPPFFALWRDKHGKFSWLRTAALLAGTLPVVLVIDQAIESAAPGYFSVLASLIYHSGVISIWLVLAALSITPLRRLTGYGKLIGARRILGVSAFCYAALHVVAYILLREGSLEQMGGELIKRVTIIVALISLLMLTALFATSNDAMVKRLGGDRWATLHKLVYWACGLAILHYVLSPGSYAGDPFIMAGVFIYLMGWRVVQGFWGDATAPLPLTALAVVAAALSGAFEFIALMTFKIMTPAEIWQINYVEAGSSWPVPLIVLLVGLGAAAIPYLSRLLLRTA